MQISRDTQATYEYYWSHGMISDEIGLTIMNDCNFNASYDNLSKSCKDAMVDAQDVVSEYIDNYDVILDVCYPSIAEQELRLKKMVLFAFHLFCFGDDIFIFNNGFMN